MALKTVTVFAESINGADGIAFDHRGRLWVCANQADELVALPLTDAQGDEPEEDVTTYTVARIPLD